jgi:hypothetical protein
MNFNVYIEVVLYLLLYIHYWYHELFTKVTRVLAPFIQRGLLVTDNFIRYMYGASSTTQVKHSPLPLT